VDVDEAAARVQKRRQLGEEKELTVEADKGKPAEKERKSEVKRFKKIL